MLSPNQCVYFSSSSYSAVEVVLNINKQDDETEYNTDFVVTTLFFSHCIKGLLGILVIFHVFKSLSRKNG